MVNERKRNRRTNRIRKSGRYTTPKGPEVEFEPGSRMRVLRNRLGIRRKMEMDRMEFEALVVAQEKYLSRVGPRTRLTADLLCRMHSDWLGAIYEWAGQYRTVELTKGDFRWPPAFRVAENMDAFEKGVLARCTPCRPGPLTEVARCIAEVHAELLLIHPFREGNGRLARWVSDLMAFQAGLPGPDYGFVGRHARRRRTAYLDAVRRGYMKDYDPLMAFFVEALERRLRKEPGG
jgi:cell filamentation protein